MPSTTAKNKSSKNKLIDLSKLSKTQKGELAYKLWSELENDDISVSDQEIQLLEKRVESVQNGTARYVTWQTVLKQLKE